MADATLITSLSRRAMLAGGAVAVAVPGVSAAAFAPPPAVPPADPSFAGPDGEVLRRVAAAERWRAEYEVADAECARLYDILYRHPDYPRTWLGRPNAGAVWDDLAGRIGIVEADARWERLYEVWEAATRAAFEVPARTLDGAGAKLRLGIATLEAEHRGGIDPVDCGYLDGALADLARLAAG